MPITRRTILDIQYEYEKSQQTLCDVLLSARHAFQLFEKQNTLLASSFDRLEQNLEHSEDALAAKVSELQQVLSRLHCILESLSDGVLVINLDGKIEYHNAAALKILGLNTHALEHQTYDGITSSLLQRRRLNHVMESCASDLYREIELDCQDGGRLILQSSMTPVLSPTEGMLGVVEVFRNVTELRQLERQFKHAQHMASLGEMAAGVAHELRNPLGAIEGFARLLKNDLDRENLPRYSRLAEKIVEGTGNLNYVVTNLLDYARPVHLEYSMFAINPMLCSMVELLTGAMRQHEVELLVQDVAQEVQFFGDQRQLRHVLLNLVKNGIEACEPGGEVSICFYQYQGEVAFHVSDTGSGISEEHVRKIFDPFFTTKHGGTGLGLSFCHKIIEAHGGELLVQSHPGRGTVFQVVLPLWRNV
jgi:PAS domain S-box-containing protein